PAPAPGFLLPSPAPPSTSDTAELVSMGTWAASSWSFCCRAWVFLWFLRLEKVLKALPHCGQACGRSPVCVRRCSARCMLWMKPFPHTSQRNGRSPECVRRCSRRCSGQASLAGASCNRLCCRRLDDWEKVRSHTSQRYGRTPEWMRLWRMRLASDEKVLPQSEHWKGRSPVCVRRWLRMWICFLNDLEQTPHKKLRSGTWNLRRWLASCSGEEKVLGQERHEKAPLSGALAGGAGAAAGS
uniref:Uncharacterized protein n=1 Tax=Gadus morhua TaxID=8049 RepID=A0A8C5AF11_GADMO